MAKEKKQDPTKCPHARINRILDDWECTDCNAEFVPKDNKHKTKR